MDVVSTANARTATNRKLRAHLQRSLEQAAAALERRHVELGERIAAARKAKQWKQKELAAAVHVEPTTVSRWETGAHTPDITMLGRIAEALGVTLRDLIPEETGPLSEIVELRDEVRELRRSFLELVVRVDKLLAEQNLRRPGMRYKPADFGEAPTGRARSEPS